MGFLSLKCTERRIHQRDLSRSGPTSQDPLRFLSVMLHLLDDGFFSNVDECCLLVNFLFIL
jgi:hypothetical protein